MKKYMIVISFLLIFSIVAIGCSNDNDAETVDQNTDQTLEETIVASVNTINAEEVMEMMDSGDEFVLVDVRTQEEYDEGHIDGAQLLPLNQLEVLSEEHLTDKEATILVYCRTGNRSAQASQILVDLGYENVYDFGGIVDWPGEIVK